MKSVEWKTYRTRFLVKAKQLNSSLNFTDHLGRQHSGRKGDYLVESCDGVLSIAPRRIFEDIYVPMGLTPGPLGPPDSGQGDAAASRENLRLASLRIEPLRIEKVKSNFRDESYGSVTLEKTPRPHRKSPQSVRISMSEVEPDVRKKVSRFQSHSFSGGPGLFRETSSRGNPTQFIRTEN